MAQWGAERTSRLKEQRVARHRVAIVWLRKALRLADNPALTAALDAADTVVPVYVHGTGPLDPAPGSASLAWLSRSLEAFDASLAPLGAGLVVRQGPPEAVLGALAAECGAGVICFDERFEPEAAAADARTCLALSAAGIETRAFNCSLLRDPRGPLTSGGGPYKVFTPYYNACLRLGAGDPPLPGPTRLPVPPGAPRGVAPLAVGGTATGPPRLVEYFTPGEAGARAKVERFFAGAHAHYPADRDRPECFGTSRISPHLAFGEIGPRQLLHASAHAATRSSDAVQGVAAYTRQLLWREFAAHLLHHFPHTVTRPMRNEFAAMPWANDPAGLAAWRSGMTGFPIVDAGMRELAATGWMHNRVRMIAASVLTKDLLLPWQSGAAYFAERLVDADTANNIFGWQWVAGSGADAAPYFRVFNPAVQGARFDSAGAYVRAWVPELATLPDRWVHRPHEASATVLAEAGVRLGVTYPWPIVDHAEARVRALAAYGAVRAGRR